MRGTRLLFLILLALALALTGCKGDGEKGKAKKAKKVETKKVEKAEQPADDDEAEAEADDELEADAEAETDEPKTEPAADDGKAAVEEKAEPDTAGPAKIEDTEDELIDTVVAKVNGNDIDAKDYVDRLKKLTKGKVTKSMLKKTVIDRMINDQLLAQEIETLSIEVTDEEIAGAMNMDMERYEKQKAAMGARVKAFQERVAVRKLLQARGLLSEPTDDELKKEYERRFGLKIDAVTVPLPRDGNDDAIATAEEQAKGILTDAQSGKTLRETVKDKKDPNGRRIIVKPMFIKKGDERHKELWEAANPLAEKALAGPVKTAHGFVVFQLSKRIEPRQTFDEMKGKLAKSALNMKTAQAKHRLLEELRKAAQIEYLIEFKASANVPRLRGLKGGRISPTMSPGGRDVLRKTGPAGARIAPVKAPEAKAEPTPEKPAEAPAE